MSLRELCTRCALCCDGTLFNQVALLADEVRTVTEAGLTTQLRADGRPCLKHPCEALDGHVCTVYGSRPGACHQFLCLLGAAYLGAAFRDGDAALDDALEKIAEARRRVASEGRAGADAYLRQYFLGDG